MDDRIYIYLIDMPVQIHEIVTPCIDGYTIYINARLSAIGQHEAYEHAKHHIDHHDFEKDNVQEVESRAWRRNEKRRHLHASEQ